MREIVEARKAIHMTQVDMSDYFGIPISIIEDWESGTDVPIDALKRLILEQLKALRYPSLMKRLLKECEEIADNELIPNPKTDQLQVIRPEISHDDYFRIIHENMSQRGIIDQDYLHCPPDIDPAYLDNVRAGKEIHKIIF